MKRILCLSLLVASTAAAQPAQPAPGSKEHYDACFKQLGMKPKSMRESIFILLAADPDSTRYVTNEDLLKVIPYWDGVAETCEAACKGVKNSDYAKEQTARWKDVDWDAELWCKLAAQDRTPLIKRNVLNQMRSWRLYKEPVDMEKVREEHTKNQGYYWESTVDTSLVPRSLDIARKQLKEEYVKLGYDKVWKLGAVTDAEMEPVFDYVMEKDVARWKVIDETAPTYKFGKGPAKDKAIEAMAKKMVLADIKTAKVLGSYMDQKEFKIVKTPLGVPTYRWKGGSIWFQVPGEKWCRQSGFTYTENYDGRKYVKPTGLKLDLYRYIDCKP